MSAGGPKWKAAPPTSADVGIVAALAIEVNPLIARLVRVRRYSGPRWSIVEGELAGKVVAIALTGPGRTAAARGARLLLDGHRPSWVLSAGFGGALTSDLTRGDSVLAAEIVDGEGGQSFTIDVVVPPDPGRPGHRVLPGRLVTVDRIARTVADKAALRDRTGADVVDMETFAVAELCGARDLHFLSIRVISDEAGVDLPPEVVAIMGRTGGYQVGAALGAIWHRPSSLPDLLRLRQHANLAAARLAGVVAGAIGRLP